MTRDYAIVPDGVSYTTLIDGEFPCNFCEEIADKAYYQERTGKAIWNCSLGHQTMEVIGV